MSLERILNAESVAIVGASKIETKRGYQSIRTLLDGNYGGRIYPVNPKEKSILGFRCYKKGEQNHFVFLYDRGCCYVNKWTSG